MMNKLNLIILSITVVVIICVGIYLYKNDKNNQVNTEPFYQAASQANPITIADMATKISEPISEPTQYLNLVFPSTLVGSMVGTPVVKFDSANANVINGLSNINTIGISPPKATYVSDSKIYSGNVSRLNEGSYMFLLDSLIDGTYQFNVTFTGQNQSIEPSISLSLFIEQLNSQSVPSTILAYSRSSAPTGGGYGTCSLNLIKSITAIKPLNIRLTANSTLDIRLLNLSILILRIN
jgi:hypothetical protein